jgi:hypothetical protein
VIVDAVSLELTLMLDFETVAGSEQGPSCLCFRETPAVFK